MTSPESRIWKRLFQFSVRSDWKISQRCQERRVKAVKPNQSYLLEEKPYLEKALSVLGEV